MGYYTKYSLEISGPKEALDRVNMDEQFGEYELTISGLINNIYEEMKWYDYQNDMIELSKTYPNVLFVLSGEGEEKGDIWKAYYRNGKSKTVEAETVFPDVDVDKELPVDERLEDQFKLQRKVELTAELNRIKAELQSLDSN